MKLLPTARIRNVMRTVQNRVGAKAIILTYHRVLETPSDPQLLAVSPDHFSQHLEILNRLTSPVHLEELIPRLKTRSRRDRPLSVVTLDDGYADNLYTAAPLLAKHGVPATVFVATATINHPHEFWWDDLDRLILHPDLPSTLQLDIEGEAYTWRFRDEPADPAAWNVYQTPRRACQKVYLEIASKIRSLSPKGREEVLEQLRRLFGIGRLPRADHRTMTEDELRCLTADGLISVGAHTVNHPVLSSLSVANQVLEIKGSRERLEAITGHPVRAFCYPYGRSEDYSRQTVEAVKAAGFTCACTTVTGITSRWTDPLQLLRFRAGNRSGNVFSEYIKEIIKGHD